MTSSNTEDCRKFDDLSSRSFESRLPLFVNISINRYLFSFHPTTTIFCRGRSKIYCDQKRPPILPHHQIFTELEPPLVTPFDACNHHWDWHSSQLTLTSQLLHPSYSSFFIPQTIADLCKLCFCGTVAVVVEIEMKLVSFLDIGCQTFL